jgi:hypothetical protein
MGVSPKEFEQAIQASVEARSFAYALFISNAIFFGVFAFIGFYALKALSLEK